MINVEHVKRLAGVGNSLSSKNSKDDNLDKAKKLLKDALALHKAHMDGEQSTTQESQKKLMAIIKTAYDLLV